MGFLSLNGGTRPVGWVLASAPGTKDPHADVSEASPQLETKRFQGQAVLLLIVVLDIRPQEMCQPEPHRAYAVPGQCSRDGAG